MAVIKGKVKKAKIVGNSKMKIIKKKAMPQSFKDRFATGKKDEKDVKKGGKKGTKKGAKRMNMDRMMAMSGMGKMFKKGKKQTLATGARAYLKRVGKGSN